MSDPTGRPDLRDLLRARLVAARRGRDRETAAALRGAVDALDHAEAVPVPESGGAAASSTYVAGAAGGLGAGDVPRRMLSRAEQVAVLQREAAGLVAAGDDYARLGLTEQAGVVRRQAEVLAEVLAGVLAEARTEARAGGLPEMPAEASANDDETGLDHPDG